MKELFLLPPTEVDFYFSIQGLDFHNVLKLRGGILGILNNDSNGGGNSSSSGGGSGSGIDSGNGKNKDNCSKVSVK